MRRAGYRLVGVEPYGGLLAHTWLDRELTVAGRLAVRGADGDVETHRVVLPGAPLRLPSLAIHLDRGVRDGLVLDPQRHLVPVWGADLGSEPGLLEALADAAGVAAGDVLGHDLVVADTQPAGGHRRRRHLGRRAAAGRPGLLPLRHPRAAGAPDPAARTAVLVANDHEEVGSGSAEGARGSFLGDVLARLVAATGDTDPQSLHRAVARLPAGVGRHGARRAPQPRRAARAGAHPGARRRPGPQAQRQPVVRHRRRHRRLVRGPLRRRGRAAAALRHPRRPAVRVDHRAR